MSDVKIFGKSKSLELRAELDQAFKKSKPIPRVKTVLRKILANIILNNNEVADMMSDVIPLLKLDDMEVRKLCLEFIATYSNNTQSDDSLNAIPYLEKLSESPSPILRALVIRAISSVRRREFIDVGVSLATRMIKDPDPYVRKTTAFSIARLYQYDHGAVERENLVDELNKLLYDDDQLVVANALAALSSITENSKTLTLKIDKAHSLQLISFLDSTNEWHQIYLLNALMSYVPQRETEALDLIEAVLPSLQHENAAVVLNAIKIIIYYSKYVKNPELKLPILPKRLGTSLISLLSKTPEVQFLVLRNVILLLLGNKELVHFEVEMFYCRFDDPIYVKDTKLEIIYLLANEQNVGSVLLELEEYATEVDIPMARKAIRAFGNLAVKLENAASQCVEIICDLMSHGISYIVQESTIAIKNILRKYPGEFNFAINELIKHYHLIDEPDAKTALIWIVGQYCEIIEEDTVQMLDDFISSFKDDPIEVQYATLTAATKYYLKYPTRGESIVLRVLKWATEEVDNPDIRDRGYIYWRLISSEHATSADGEFQENTKKIILNSNPVISSENDSIHPAILEELDLNIGTLASIYLKPVHTVFRSAKRKTLPISPALQRKGGKEQQHLEPVQPERPTSRTASPAIEINRRMSYRRTNSDNVTTLRTMTTASARENSLTSKKDKFSKRFSRTASLIKGKISNKN
ncbi:uncharacterized protein J8A68_004306 [[Candida] subhashii]|uniref:AP complex subunit beta n=1 Tax=[Candida] subhashii TaxID=561895 RepID=A0A8J5UFY8_9ASCO|nr:uncharacterized protein J8A68_004306 [[Candida] subhashii]KAG7662178.1 hypothetical protein J8A68_004306 [[Candida] subhashii]